MGGDRDLCRGWVSGQSDHGAQSVALSGGYEDDIDKGDHFLYTGRCSPAHAFPAALKARVGWR